MLQNLISYLFLFIFYTIIVIANSNKLFKYPTNDVFKNVTELITSKG